jgi:hypothetical protein
MKRRSVLGATLAAVFVALAWTAACRTGPPTLPRRGTTRFEHGVAALPEERRSELWISYQLAVLAIDGVPARYAAAERCLYYALELPPGEHRLELRLEYDAPLEVVRSPQPAELTVTLAPGAAYRLFDLNAGRKRGWTFHPWLENGAPLEGFVVLERTAQP